VNLKIPHLLIFVPLSSHLSCDNSAKIYLHNRTGKGLIMAQAIKQVKPGDRVKINFNGTLKDGTLFDTTYEKDDCEDHGCGCDDNDCSCEDDGNGCEDDGCGCGGEGGPMELTVGAEDFFPQIEDALIGMSPGDKKTLTILAVDAFGKYDAEMISTVPRNQFPEELNPMIGDDLELVSDDGEGMVVTVIELDDVEVTLDANHPLAGEDLTFEVELVEIL
jgi:peptidylprolyl isomerase